MARRVRDKNIETREARAKLKPRPTPYWRAIGRGLHLGYRKGKKKRAAFGLSVSMSVSKRAPTVSPPPTSMM